MTSFLTEEGRAGLGRTTRLWCVGAVACGVLLVDATGAIAAHSMANGVLCPHATGEGPNAQPPPSQPAGPERAGSTAPLGTASKAPAPTATPAAKPAAQAQAQPAKQPASKPATQAKVQQPAAQARTQQPVRAAQPEAVRTLAVAAESQPREAATTAPRVQQPQAAGRPARAQRVREAARSGRDQQNRPAAAIGSARNVVKPIDFSGVAPVERSQRPVSSVTASPDGSVSMTVVLLGLVALGGLAGGVALMRRRRGDGGAALEVASLVPSEPSRLAAERHEAFVEASLQEMIAEVRARELLGAEDEAERSERSEFTSA